MTSLRQHFDAGSLLIIVITFVLFVAALYFTGFTHDLLLEAGVFLVSVKLIVMSYKNKVASDSLHQELAPAGIHAATVTIGGMVGSSPKFAPEAIAEAYWTLHAQPQGSFEREIVWR